jgi:hypothetical protein
VPVAEKPGAALPISAPDDTQLYTMAAAIRLQDALALYGVALAGAGSFALLMADNIRYSADAFAGWEDFASHPNFATGVNELARIALSNANKQLDGRKETYAPRIERLRAFTGSLEPVKLEGEAWCQAYERYCGTPDAGQFENSVHAMTDLIGVMANTLCDRWKSNAMSYYMGQVVKDELDAAFSELHLAFSDVDRATIAIGLKSEQHQETA